jgi:long-chain acyl-CoA synthetase
VPLDHTGTSEFASRVAADVQARIVFKARPSAWASASGALGAIDLESLGEVVAARDAGEYPAAVPSRDETLEIIYTSGTTAEPRGVVISHGNVLANIAPLEREIAKYLKWERIFHPIRFLNLLPLSHVFGQMLGVFIPPLIAGTVIFLDSPKPAELATAIKRERVSVLVAVPRFLESLQREIERDYERDFAAEKLERDLARGAREKFLRRWVRFRRIHSRLGWKFWAFISGGAALPEATETFWNRVGYAVVQGYGMTETTSLITLNHPFRASKGSIGKTFPGIEVRVDDNGEILVRGENVATAYMQHGERHSVADADGWFRTGDIASKDAEGRLFFKGRSKNVIVTPAGMNIYPEDLEAAVKAQPEIRDCVVVGIERDGNAEPCAAVLMRGTTDASDAQRAIERANAGLVEYQRIRRWIVWPDSDFPRTSTQKPILTEIRAQAQAEFSGAWGRGASDAASMPRGDSLAALISKITNRPVPPGGDVNLERDLQLSSLDRVELMSALEQRYQVEFSDSQFQQANTVAQLEALLAKGSQNRVPYEYPLWPQNQFVTAVRLLVYYALAWPATYLMAAPKIIGRENLRGMKGPVLVVSNHVTYLDIAWVLPALPPRFRHRLSTAMGGERLAEKRHAPEGTWIGKRLLELLNYYLVVALFNVFPLPQRAGFLESFSFAGNLADRGWSLLVFPEGETTDGTMTTFRGGIGLLARQLNVPVVPMYIDGLREIKRKRSHLNWPGTVRVNIGKPVTFSADADAETITRELERRVRGLAPALVKPA